MLNVTFLVGIVGLLIAPELAAPYLVGALAGTFFTYAHKFPQEN